MPHPDVTAIVNLHREGQQCVPSIRSAVAAVERARLDGVACQLLLVLDRADDTTIASATAFSDDSSVELLHVDHGDLGYARNSGVAAASGDAVAFLDGDDLWGDEWLTRAFRLFSAIDTDVVLHPVLSLVHGADVRAVRHPSSDEPAFDLDRFRVHNAWTALSFASRDLYERVPFPPNRIDAGFGFEDWSWNAEILRRGIVHRTVPETFHVLSLTDDSSSLKVRSRTAVRTEWGAT